MSQFGKKLRCFGRYAGFSLLLLPLGVSVSLFWYQETTAASLQPQRSKKAMVVSPHPLASEAGVLMLQKGGNAVDAAVATTFAISVVEPFAAGIGGGGFLLLHQGQTGEIKALDFRERAPLQARRDMYLDAQGNVIPNASRKGYLAVGVPGTVAGLYEVHRRYGKLPWREVVAPAIRLAQEGFVVSWRLRQALEQHQEALLSNAAARQIFFRDGVLYEPGERLVQQDLGRTLQAIARDPQSFYTGNIARAIARDMANNGGLITLEDLKIYQPIWRTPLCGTFRVYRVCSMPPPSSGGVHLLQMLNLIGDTDFKSMGWHHPDVLHFLVEIMRIAYADRAVHLGDPDFVNVPVEALTSRPYAQQRRREISMERARASREVQAADEATLRRLSRESNDTSHLTVVDEQRNTVSLTFTINYRFGSGVVVPGTGIILNNEMDDFAIAPGVPNLFGLVGSEANAIAPRKTPLSSMTPTVVTENNRLRLATGSPGGSTIITTVLQIILNVLVYDMDAGAAVAASRLHHQWLPDKLWLEQWGFDTATLQELQRRGHQTDVRSPWGNANLILQTPDGWLEGAADPRGEGAPRGF